MPDDEFYQLPDERLCQGDILVTPHLRIKDKEGTIAEDGFIKFQAEGKPTLGLIMNFDCELDKPWSETVVVCPIVPLSDLRETLRANAKKNRIAHLFFMPRHGSKLVDSVAILNQQTTLDHNLLDLSSRVATLSITGRFAFYGQFVRWVSRWELTGLTCPKCGVEFDPADVLPTRDPGAP